MATLESISEKLDTLATAIAAIPTTGVPAMVDLSPVLNAVADLKTEVQKNVEGAPPAP